MAVVWVGQLGKALYLLLGRVPEDELGDFDKLRFWFGLILKKVGRRDGADGVDEDGLNMEEH